MKDRIRFYYETNSMQGRFFLEQNKEKNRITRVAMLRPCTMYDNKTCPVGLEHRSCEFGKQYDSPTISIINDGPRFVFIGEAPGRNGCGTYGIPFMGDRSGTLFMDALWELEINPASCYIDNIIRCCPEKNDLKDYYNIDKIKTLECYGELKKNIKKLKYFGKIFAIGKTAYKSLASMGLEQEIVRVNHPAWYLRAARDNQFVIDLGLKVGLKTDWDQRK